MPFTLNNIPGFADQPDSTLAADKAALGIKLGRINANAAFGMARTEIFAGTYHDGETVPLPVSPIDGYVYARSELIYIWAPQQTGNPGSSYGPPWTMWYIVYKVDQSTGVVSCATGYRGNQDHTDRQANTSDGILTVWTIAQRQKASLVVATPPTFTEHTDSHFVTDKPLNQSLVQEMNQSAKASVINSEVIYMGEFHNGQTVPHPVSPADGYTYSYAETAFHHSIRWTSDDDGTNAQTPSIYKGQLKDWSVGINASTGAVSMAVIYESNGDHSYTTGRIAVFAFCQRTASALSGTANDFAEIDDSVFWSGQTLRADTLKQLEHNIRQASRSPEFFGPYDKVHGNTIAVPTSAIDGYVYSRSELMYLWTFKDTGPDASPFEDRMSFDGASIDPTTGTVSINSYRFKGGASTITLQHDGTISVVIFAKRNAEHVYEVLAPSVPGDYDTSTTDLLDPLASGSSSPLDGQGSTNPLAITASAVITGVLSGGAAAAQQTITGGTIYRASGNDITVPGSGPTTLTTWLGSALSYSTNYNANIVWDTVLSAVVRQEFTGSSTIANRAVAVRDGKIPINIGINFTTPSSGGSGGGGGGGSSCFTPSVEVATKDGAMSFEALKAFRDGLFGVQDHGGRLREAVLIEHGNYDGEMIQFDPSHPEWGVHPDHGFRDGDGWIPASKKFRLAPRFHYSGPVYSLFMLDSKNFDDANFLLANGLKPHNLKIQ